jgi:quinoprotein glucose dehydrogenase
VILGIVLAAAWMSVAVLRTREYRQGAFDYSSPTPTPAPATLATNDPLAEYRSTLTRGNAERGRKIFFEKPEANCAKCHHVGNQGGDMGPPLDGFGTNHTHEYILQSLILPNSRTLEGYETVILLLKNGSGCSGLLKSESDSDIVVHTPEDGPVTVKKSDVQLRQKGLSQMPEGLGQILSKQDIADLIEFVASLKTPSTASPNSTNSPPK